MNMSFARASAIALLILVLPCAAPAAPTAPAAAHNSLTPMHLDFIRVGALTLNQGENYLQCAAIDPGAGFAYFGTDTAPGQVVKVRVSFPYHFYLPTAFSNVDAR